MIWWWLVGCSPIEVRFPCDEACDIDGDGVSADLDCDDRDPGRYPGLAEIPYDGIDQDCTGGDQDDLDGDGVPWPVDCRDDPDAWPDARLVVPGQPDEPYDGIDSDCAGDDDFDQDGDGYAPPADAYVDGSGPPTFRQAHTRFVQDWGLNLDTRFGDCDDTYAKAHPGAREHWYDGIDGDCAGDNDYDRDGDGYFVEGATWTHIQSYADRYFGGVVPWSTAPGDCDDRNPDIHPAASEIAYDGLDNDCQVATLDTDLDGDGVLPPADCDDTDAEVFPGQPERLGDGKDQDCDGKVDTARWVYGNIEWAAPREPVLAVTTDDVVLVTSADAMHRSGAVTYDTGVLLRVSQGGLLAPPTTFASGSPMGMGVDADAQNGDLVTSLSYVAGFDQRSYLLLDDWTWNAGSASYVNDTESGTFLWSLGFDDVEIRPHINQPMAVGCAPGAVEVVRGDGRSQGASAWGGTACFFEDANTVVVCDGANGCTSIDVNLDGTPTLQPSAQQSWQAEQLADVDSHDGWLVAVGLQGGVDLIDGSTRHALLAGEPVLSADAVWKGGDVYLAAVIDAQPRPEIWLYHGPPTALSALPLPALSQGALPARPEHVAIALTASDELVLAVSATGTAPDLDSVGWTTLLP